MTSTTTSNKIKNIILYCVGIVIVLLIISLIGLIKDNSIVFPSAFEIIKSFFGLFSQGDTYIFIGNTLLDFIISLLFSIIIGFSLGTLAGFNNNVRMVLKPLMVMLRSLPMIILIVIVMLIIPNNNYRHVPYIATTLTITPIIYEGIAEGIKGVDRQYIDVYRLNSNLNTKVIFRVYYPLIKGYINQALVNAIGMGIKIIVACEYLAGIRNTLGNAIYNSKILIEYTDIYAYAILLVLIVVLVELLPKLIICIINAIKRRKNNNLNKENEINKA